MNDLKKEYLYLEMFSTGKAGHYEILAYNHRGETVATVKSTNSQLFDLEDGEERDSGMVHELETKTGNKFVQMDESVMK